MHDLTWETVEFTKHEKSGQWYAALWAVALGLGIVGFLLDSILMIALVGVAALVVTLYAAKEPRQMTVTLSEKELVVNGRATLLEEFASFWIFERRDHNVLSLYRRSAAKPGVNIIMPSGYAARARMLLRPHVPEEEHEESLIDTLADRLKF